MIHSSAVCHLEPRLTMFRPATSRHSQNPSRQTRGLIDVCCGDNESMLFPLWVMIYALETDGGKNCFRTWSGKKTTERRMNTWLFKDGSNPAQLPHAKDTRTLPFLLFSCLTAKLNTHQIAVSMSEAMTCQLGVCLCVYLKAVAAALGRVAGTSTTAHRRLNTL